MNRIAAEFIENTVHEMGGLVPRLMEERKTALREGTGMAQDVTLCGTILTFSFCADALRESRDGAQDLRHPGDE